MSSVPIIGPVLFNRSIRKLSGLILSWVTIFPQPESPKSSGFLLKAQFELSVIFCTVAQVEVYQILIANPGFLGQGFEVTDGLGINTNRYLLFELPCVGVGCGLREIVFCFYTVPPYQLDSFLVALSGSYWILIILIIIS